MPKESNDSGESIKNVGNGPRSRHIVYKARP